MKKYLVLIGFCCIAVFQLHAASPSRIENKSFSDVKEIRFDQSFGNITVKESDTGQVRLEIQYYDGKSDKAVCDISAKSNYLSIKTIRPKNVQNETIKIDYVINVPRAVALNVELKYGDIVMNDFYGTFNAQLAFSNLKANAFIGTNPSVSCKYGDIKINEADDVVLSTEFSNVKINTAKKLNIKSKYTEYKIDKIQSIAPGGSSEFDKFKIGSIGSIGMNLKYSGLSIETLEKSMNVKCDFSDVKINTASKGLEKIELTGTYSDLSIGLHPELSANFDVNLNFGDLKIAKNYDVKYTFSEERHNKVRKTGTIGNQSPKANIIVSNSFADVKIK